MMRRVFCYVVSSICAALTVSAEAPRGNSEKGERLFETQQCIQCHSVKGHGGRTAPDLGRRMGRNQSPTLLTSTLWNHAPTMWSEIRRQAISVPSFSTQDSADLFAYFYSTRFFDRPGDAGRGKVSFGRHNCANCHDIAAVAKWQSLGSPILLAEAMWNHANDIQSEFARRGFSWPQLTAQELTDIFVYLSNHPAVPRRTGTFEIKSAEGGEALLKEKGCLECHKGSLNLASRLQGKTLNDIAVAMWNHAPKMTQSAGKFQPGEMGTLLSYLWANQFFESSGSAPRGKKVFGDKGCAGCHEAGKAPRLTGEFDTIRLTSALWNHGPAMLEQMRQQGTPWPRFNEREMADLIAYLDTGR